MKPLNRLFFILAVAALIAGCGGGPSTIDLATARQMVAESEIDTTATYLTESYRQKAAEDESGGALHHVRIGLEALRQGDRTLAAQSFDAALLVIETIYGDDESAQKARETYSAESDKVFRGEPYERAMAYYYRGVLYLMEEDYENARASFRSAFLQDSLAGSQVHQEDFAMLAYLEGWASQCNGDVGLAQEAYQIAQKHNSKLVLPAPDSDVLVLAEHGGAPFKYNEGQYGQFLKILPSNPRPDGDFYIGASTEPVKLPNTESVAYQAITRGGRAFDAILKGQAQFKEESQQSAENALVVAQAAQQASSQLANAASSAAAGSSAALSNATASVGMSAFALGALIYSSAKESAARKANPTADSRQWDNLPDSVAYGAYRTEAGDLHYGRYAVNETGGSAQAVFKPHADSAERLTLQQAGGNRCRVVWARHHTPQIPADGIPAFMKTLDGCWDVPVQWANSEQKVISSDIFLNRTGDEIMEVGYQVTGPNSFSYTSWGGVSSSSSFSSFDRTFENDNTINSNGFIYRRIPAEKCDGLQLQ